MNIINIELRWIDQSGFSTTPMPYQLQYRTQDEYARWSHWQAVPHVPVATLLKVESNETTTP